MGLLAERGEPSYIKSVLDDHKIVIFILSAQSKGFLRLRMLGFLSRRKIHSKAQKTDFP
jgi:hypothetical protein